MKEHITTRITFEKDYPIGFIYVRNYTARGIVKYSSVCLYNDCISIDYDHNDTVFGLELFDEEAKALPSMATKNRFSS